jgi:hypothetical protein
MVGKAQSQVAPPLSAVELGTGGTSCFLASIPAAHPFVARLFSQHEGSRALALNGPPANRSLLTFNVSLSFPSVFICG